MSDETKEQALAQLRTTDLGEWGSYDEVLALGERLKMLLPGGDKMSGQQAMAAAQYFMSIGANPFRGEGYAYVDTKGIHFVDGYKLLTRWAMRECRYSDRYIPMGEEAHLVEGDIGVWCIILRDDRKDKLDEYLAAGASFDVAYELVATKAGGVVTKKEQGSRAPPTGWTWLDVARKRALKNALNLAYGMPSMKELAAESWMVDDQETKPQDWDGIEPGTPQADAEAMAVYNAKERERHENPETPDLTAAKAIADLYDLPMPPGDEPGGDEGPEQGPLPFPEDPTVPETWAQFLEMAPMIGFTEDQALDLRAEWSREGSGISVSDAWDHLIDAKAAIEGA